MFYQILQKLVRQFFMSKGRAPRSAMEWQQLRSRARELVSEQGDIPSITSKTTIDDLIAGPHISEGSKGERIWDFSKDLPTRDVQSRTADVIPFPKGITASKKVKAMMKSGDVKLGEAPRTLPETLKSKKDRHILMRDADEDILRIKRENKEAIERFQKKMNPQTVEDFRDKGDWDPSGMAYGGIAPLVGEPSYAADFYDDRTPMEKGKKAKKKKKKLTPEDDIFQGPSYETDNPKEAVKEIVSRIVGSGIAGAPIGGGFEYGLGYGEDRPFDYGIGYNVDPGLGGLYADYGIRRDDENVYSGGYKGDNWDMGVRKEEGSDPTFGFNWKKKFNQGGRARMAGGGPILKFIEALFIKASNQIRQGKGKWKGLTQEQWIKQHDNLTKKLKEWEMGGKKKLPTGASQYLGMNDLQIARAVKEAEKTVKSPLQKEISERTGKVFDPKTDQYVTPGKKPKSIIPKDEYKEYRNDFNKEIDERTMIKQKYPGITDDLIEKILVDDNPQRKAEVLATMDQFLKLKEVGKGSEEAFDIVTKSIKDPTTHAEGGRAGYIFGGSAGLRGLWKHILKNVSKGQGKKIDKFFPKLSAEEKRLEKMVMGSPEQKAFREGEVTNKIEGIEHIIDRLKHDKKILERQAKNKAMRDPGLDFLMENLEESMPEIYGPRLKKYTDIDKDVLDMETIKKNLIMKDRKLNAEGGRIEYAGGGLAGLPPITQGLPQGPGIQQPPMAAGPPPAGIPGGTIVAQNQMQQNPWMGQQMPQGSGGMPRPGGMPQRGQPRPGGMPRPMAAEGGRMPFGLGGIGRRAFLKLMGAGAATGVAAKSGLFGLLKAGKPITGALTSVPIKDISGMPVWFKPLVNRVIKDGNDVSKTHASKDMELVHKTVLPDSNTDVLVTQSLDTGDVVVDIGLTKHGFADGKFGQPVRLEYKASEVIEPTISKTGKVTSKGTKTKPEFWVDEAEFTGGHPENVKFEETISSKFGKHESDFSEVEAFAKGKRKKVRLKQIESSQKEAEDLADHFSNYPEPDDFATGGLAYALGE